MSLLIFLGRNKGRYFKVKLAVARFDSSHHLKMFSVKISMNY